MTIYLFYLIDEVEIECIGQIADCDFAAPFSIVCGTTHMTWGNMELKNHFLICLTNEVVCVLCAFVNCCSC